MTATQLEITMDRNLKAAVPRSISQQVVANALATVADEMATTIFRTAHSTVVRDAMDFSAALCSPIGETIAQAVTIPLHLGSIPTAMSALLKKFGANFVPGDVYIGGRVPGTSACENTDIFQEGLRFPWIRLYAAGNPVEDLLDVIRTNVRIPRMTMGDLNAQVAACNVGQLGLEELAARYGNAPLRELMEMLLDHTERVVRSDIAKWPDGSAEFTDYLDSDGIEVCDVPIRVKLTVAGDRVIADFSNSSPMVRGALNSTKST
ncbi:MAG: hydantoinase B/oxoprolinase family protein, partial [Mesorhizobium sp.]